MVGTKITRPRDGRHKNSLPRGWTDRELNGWLKDNLPKGWIKGELPGGAVPYWVTLGMCGQNG